jgi:hypothetical protein
MRKWTKQEVELLVFNELQWSRGVWGRVTLGCNIQKILLAITAQIKQQKCICVTSHGYCCGLPTLRKENILSEAVVYNLIF